MAEEGVTGMEEELNRNVVNIRDELARQNVHQPLIEARQMIKP